MNGMNSHSNGDAAFHRAAPGIPKQNLVDILMLLSAIESWSFSSNSKMPDYLIERLDTSIEVIRKEVLK